MHCADSWCRTSRLYGRADDRLSTAVPEEVRCVDAIFLDAYGTLFDEHHIFDAMVLSVAEETGMSSPVLSRRFLEVRRVLSVYLKGNGFASQRTRYECCIAALAAGQGWTLDTAALAEVAMNGFATAPLLDGAREAVVALQAIAPVCIVANADTQYLKHLLTLHRIGVSDVVTSEDVRAYKPEPQIYMVALNRMRARPSHAVMIGNDTLRDIAPAQALGLRTILVGRDSAERGSEVRPSYTVPSISDVVDAVRLCDG